MHLVVVCSKQHKLHLTVDMRQRLLYVKGFENSNSILIFIAELQVLPITALKLRHTSPRHTRTADTWHACATTPECSTHTLTTTHASRAARARCVQTHAGACKLFSMLLGSMDSLQRSCAHGHARQCNGRQRTDMHTTANASWHSGTVAS